MKIENHASVDAYNRNTGYSQAVCVTDSKRTVYVSGQIPVRPDGTVPASFKEQAELTWANIEAQLNETGLSLSNIVKHTTYLSKREYREEYSKVRRQILGDLEPALTVIIADIFDEEWLLEVEAIAVS